MLKGVRIILIILLLVIERPAFADPIRLAYVDFPPYEYVQNGREAGVLVSIVKTVFERAQVDLQLEFLPFKRAFEYVVAKRLDGLFNLYKIDDRLSLFDYSAPIITNELVLFVQSSSKLKYESIDDLVGLKIGAMRGYTYGDEFDKNSFFLKEVSSSHEAIFKKLVRGRIDAYPCDKLVGLYVTDRLELRSVLKILPNPLKILEGHIGFAKGRHQKTIHKINKVIIEMKESGEIDEMLKNIERQYELKE